MRRGRTVGSQLRESFRHAADGFGYAFATQRNIRIQLVALVIVLGAAAALRVTRVEWLLLIVVAAGVISLELVNTALEAVVNLATADYSQQAKLAKDVAAAAVLVMAGVSVIVGLVVFLPYLLTARARLP